MDLPPNVIESDGGLTLRRIGADTDAAAYHRLIDESLEHLRPWMYWVPDHPAVTDQFLATRDERWESGQNFTYAIEEHGALVGACSIFRAEGAAADVREIGYWLHPAATGRGLATRAARALVEEAFRLPGVAHVEICHDPANLPSGAVPARLGFTEFVRRPVERVAPGDTGEDLVWRISREG
ncbi:GNAT family N-acetyltransferase [Kitasatospora sp. NPDC051170]|uniref:GNAT family N-acetyltransferase n=1 Tax=Kitasatospora sp. NPDC051170 TaxID=3364056 RepID=UPI003797F833